jgi:hypothetical protein
MGLFRPRKPEVTAGMTPTASTAQLSSAGALTVLNNAQADRARAMRIPTISRARDLLAGAVASGRLEYYLTQWNGEDLEEVELPPEPWMVRPDPRTTLTHTLSWTFDSLFFHGYAAWYITSRRAVDGRPAAFTVLDPSLLTITANTWAFNVPVGDYLITYNGQTLRNEDVVLFWSPVQGLLQTGARAILIAERLDQMSLRFATAPQGYGYLRQVSGEPLTADELSDLAAGWAEARELNAVAALNEFVDFKESTMDPSRLQGVESRQHQATELARVANVSAFLVSAPTGSAMTYQNAQQAQEQLRLDARIYIECIEQTLSNDQITTRGHIVRLQKAHLGDRDESMPMDPTRPDRQDSNA